MREILGRVGYNRAAVCAAYAKAERANTVLRKSNENGLTPEQYAEALWKDGHRPRNPWIPEHCKRLGIKV